MQYARLYGITYGDILDHPKHFLGYTDTAFVNTDDQKSTLQLVDLDQLACISPAITHYV